MPSILPSGSYLLIRDKQVFSCITKIATKNVVFARKPRQILILRQNSICWSLKFCSSRNFLANTVRLFPQLQSPCFKVVATIFKRCFNIWKPSFSETLGAAGSEVGGALNSLWHICWSRGLVGDRWDRGWGMGRRSDRADFLLTMGMVGWWLVIFGSVGSWLGMVGIWDHGCWWSDRADFLLTISIASQH